MKIWKSMIAVTVTSAIAAMTSAVTTVTHANPFDGDRQQTKALRALLPQLQQSPAALGTELDKSSAAKASKASSWDAAKQQRFDVDVTAALAIANVPGVAIAVIKDGQVISLKGYGSKRFGITDPVNADSQFMIGSVSKPVTTTMMASIIDRGRVSWNTPVKQIYAPFRVADPGATNTLSLRDMVCNCIATARNDFEILLNGNELNAERLVASIANYQVQNPFGQRYLYNNQFVATGGYVAGQAGNSRTGDLLRDYHRQLSERVLQPIGMSQTTVSFEAVRDRRNFARPHGFTLNYEVEQLPTSINKWATSIAPGGGIWSTAADMAKYAITQLNRGVGPMGNRVVSAQNLETTWTPQVAIDESESYGLGWFVSNYAGRRLIEHGGNVYGFTAQIAFLPDDGIAVVALSNANNSVLPFFLSVRAFELLLDAPNNATSAVLAQAIANTAAQFKAAFAQSTAPDFSEVQSFLGEYTNAELGEATLSYFAGQLFVDFGEFETELLRYPPAGDGVYLTSEPPIPGLSVQLVRDASGRAALRLGGGTQPFVFIRK